MEKVSDYEQEEEEWNTLDEDQDEYHPESSHLNRNQDVKENY